MPDQDCILFNFEFLQKFFKKSRMFREAIRVGARLWKRIGLSHPDQIRNQTAAQSFQMRDHVSPKVGRGGIPMQKDDRGSLTFFLIGHFQPFNGDVFHRSEMSRVNRFSIFLQ